MDAGSSCRRSITLCGFEAGMQTRWLITQFINNTRRLDEIYIKVEYAITSRCSGSCLTTLDMFVLQTNATDQNFTANATEFGTGVFETLTDTARDGQTRINRIRRFSANLSNDGFYIGFRDMGTCLVLFQTTVFYAVCDAISFDIGANFTNTGFHEETYPGECFPNMKINSRMPVNTFNGRCNVLLEPSGQRDNLNINWVINGNDSLRCMCLPGYRFVNSATQKQCEGVCVCDVYVLCRVYFLVCSYWLVLLLLLFKCSLSTFYFQEHTQQH